MEYMIFLSCSIISFSGLLWKVGSSVNWVLDFSNHHIPWSLVQPVLFICRNHVYVTITCMELRSCSELFEINWFNYFFILNYYLFKAKSSFCAILCFFYLFFHFWLNLKEDKKSYSRNATLDVLLSQLLLIDVIENNTSSAV